VVSVKVISDIKQTTQPILAGPKLTIPPSSLLFDGSSSTKALMDLLHSAAIDFTNTRLKRTAL
jgi:hypothetical protein